MKLTLFFVTSFALGALAAPHNDHFDRNDRQCKPRTVYKTKQIAKTTITKYKTRTRVETKTKCNKPKWPKLVTKTKTKISTVTKPSTVTKLVTETSKSNLPAETFIVTSTAAPVDPVTIISTESVTLDPVTLFLTETAPAETVTIVTTSSLAAETVTVTSAAAPDPTSSIPVPTTTTPESISTTIEPIPTPTLVPVCHAPNGPALIPNANFETFPGHGWTYTNLSGKTIQNGYSQTATQYTHTGFGNYRAQGETGSPPYFKSHSFELATTITNLCFGSTTYKLSFWAWGAIGSGMSCMAEVLSDGRVISEAAVPIKTGYYRDANGNQADEYGQISVQFVPEKEEEVVSVRVLCSRGTVVFFDDFEINIV